ncbi:MAG: hypothetical protein K6E60_06265 [Saccharofermentans sp.]|nr:hypothetical protein [Saccharofermentans sp.]
MDNTSSNNSISTKKRNSNTATVLYYLSFLPYFIPFYFAISGISFLTRIYGIVAATLAAVFMTVSGFFPICFVFQTAFGKRHFSDNKSLKLGTFIIVSLLIALIVCIEPISSSVNEIRLYKEPSKIYNYLKTQYGQETADNANIVFDHVADYDPAIRYYKAYSTALPEGSTFEVCSNPNLPRKYTDNLLELFLKANPEYTSECQKYILEKSNTHDESLSMESLIRSIDFKDYHHGSEYSVLFERTNLELSEVTIQISNSDDESIRNAVNTVMSNEYVRNQVLSGYLISIDIKNKDSKIAYALIFSTIRSSAKNVKVFREGNNSFDPDMDYTLTLTESNRS